MKTTESMIEAGILGLRRVLADNACSQLVIVVDPALGDPFQGHAALLGNVTVQRLRIPHRDLSAEMQPYLIFIDDDVRQERVVNLSVAISAREVAQGQGEQRHPRSICGWLLGAPGSLLEPASLVAHLSSGGAMHSKARRDVLFRYYDPRVMAYLPAIFTAQQMAHLFGPVGCWQLFDERGYLQTIQRPELPVVAELQPISSRQLASLDRLGRVALLQRMSMDWDAPQLPVSADRLDAELARAEDLGLIAQDDCLVFATCAFTLGPSFINQPMMLDILSKSVGKHGAFAQRVAELDEHVLQALASQAIPSR
jgi:hypothetical protein